MANSAMKWDKYFRNIARDIPSAELNKMMDEWNKDTNFPWTEIVQDFLNWAQLDERPAATVNPEGGVSFRYNPYLPKSGKIAPMTNNYAKIFKLTPEQATNFTQTSSRLNEQMRFPALYDIGETLINRAKSRGAGVAPAMTGGESVGLGGALLGEQSQQLSPSSGLFKMKNNEGTQKKLPLSMGQALLGG